MSRVFLLLSFAACGPVAETLDEGGDSDPAGVECGNPVTYDVEIRARVEDAAGAVAGVDVALYDRGWTYVILGTGTTGADGDVSFTARGITALDGCWGTVLNYQLLAEDSAGGRSAEDDMNTELHAAIDDGSLLADVRDFPLTLR
ncbi:MAG: hypothetical protein EXR71_02575 [Myxococcales bacterium]|nr:hypothetical protein [Myxococcales bacterium]